MKNRLSFFLSNTIEQIGNFSCEIFLEPPKIIRILAQKPVQWIYTVPLNHKLTYCNISTVSA